jgi:hypothetical protein
MLIRDVKSSNGTFVNGERLSLEGAESDPFELRSDDILVSRTLAFPTFAPLRICLFRFFPFGSCFYALKWPLDGMILGLRDRFQHTASGPLNPVSIDFRDGLGFCLFDFLRLSLTFLVYPPNSSCPCLYWRRMSMSRAPLWQLLPYGL